jgi:hypothetical protein
MPINTYKSLFEKYTSITKQLRKRLNWLSFSRLGMFVLFLFFVFRLTQKVNGITIFLTLVAFAAFLFVLRWYDRLERELILNKALAKFNEDEINFLATNHSSHSKGTEYENPHHPYSYDLDVFEEGGLFSYLNRCSTLFGTQALAKDLLRPDITAITERQIAVKELAALTTFRQQLYAYGSLEETDKKELDKLTSWAEDKNPMMSKPVYFLLMIFPIVTLLSILYYFAFGNEMALNIFFKLFVLNIGITFLFAKKIKAQLSVSTSVTKTLKSYKSQLQLIEKESFQSFLLQNFQQQLKRRQLSASHLLQQLTTLFEYLETAMNLVVSPLLNGLFLFHIHILYRLGNWRHQHASHIKDWLNIIGEAEALSSLANLSYNNPSFCFPEISTTPALQATALGHVLIKQEKRVTNNVSFTPQRFVILTGSNMSGKSTFLRTIGMNLVMAKAGAAVCAKEMRFYPFDVFVSMRISDSLQNSESFFYAELKRLQAIIQQLELGHTTFVILDEILRGTNSNDKRKGTIGLIKKMAKENTFGIIATHDVVVAGLRDEYPEYVANKAFESEIKNEELLFDYKLKDGVCNTLSASYLMKKMGIIDGN